MARIQVKGGEEDDAVVQWPRVVVYTRESLKTGQWEAADYLDCLDVSRAASPGVSRASLAYRAGTVLHTDEAAFSKREPKDLVGHFVRIDFLPPEPPAKNKPGNGSKEQPLESFVMWIIDEDRSVGGDVPEESEDEAAAQPIEQRLTAVGLEDLLDQVTVTGGWAYDRTADTAGEGQPLRTPVVFNELGRVRMATLGNRSEEKVTVTDSEPPRRAYAFDVLPREDGSASDVWAVSDVIEYLVNFFVADLEISLPFVRTESGDESTFFEEFTDVEQALRDMEPARLAAEGLTVKQAIDSLLRPERGLGWYLACDPAADVKESGAVKIELVAFPVSDVAIKLSKASLPGNGQRIDLDVSRDAKVLSCVVGKSRAEQYGEILVLGEPVLSCFTLSFADKTLEKDWTTKEEAAYKKLAAPRPDDAPEVDPESPDELDSLRHVFCRYRLPYDWDGMAGDGEGGRFEQVNALLRTGGLVIADTTACLNRRRRGFEDLLPLTSRDRPDDDDYKAAGQVAYRRAFALIRYSFEKESEGSDGTSSTEDRWGYCDAMPNPQMQPCGELSMPADRHAIQLRFSVPHVMANRKKWTDLLEDAVSGHSQPGVYSYEEVVATVALRTDQRLFSRREIKATNSPVGPNREGKKLIVEVPDAELWLVAPGTVEGIDAAGKMRHYSGPEKVRDDSQRLEWIASTAETWYGRERQSLEVTWAGPKHGLTLGGYVASVTQAKAQPINLCLTAVRFDCVRRTTSLAAQYRDLSFDDLL